MGIFGVDMVISGMYILVFGVAMASMLEGPAL
jgi:hypothetical protein